MDTFPDLGSLNDQELKDLIQQLTDEEMEISYRRRILHGKIDILRAELVKAIRRAPAGKDSSYCYAVGRCPIMIPPARNNVSRAAGSG